MNKRPYRVTDISGKVHAYASIISAVKQAGRNYRAAWNQTRPWLIAIHNETEWVPTRYYEVNGTDSITATVTGGVHRINTDYSGDRTDLIALYGQARVEWAFARAERIRAEQVTAGMPA